MGFLQIEWFVAVAAVTVGIVAALVWRKRATKASGPDTFQDMSIFDEEVASGNYEIDPIAEAEVYVAYGNKEQAILLLKKAAVAHPERQDIRDKIDEIDATLIFTRRRL